MKFIYFLAKFLLPYLLLCSIVKSTANVLDSNPSPYCLNDCKVLKKIQGIFPLKGDEKELKTSLNSFNWKHFYVFSDHLSVYQASQTESIKGKFEEPQQADFLNNFPIDDIQTPCNGYKDVCTVSEFKEQVYLPLKKDLVPNSKAMDTMGKDLWNNCFLITQDLLESPEEMNYVCSKNIEDFQAVLRILNEMLNKYEGKEFIGRLYMINENHDDLLDLNVHIDSQTFLGNNVNEDIQTGPQIEGYKEFFRYNMLDDFAGPAFTLLKENLKLDWKGDETKKPDVERCFAISILQKGGRAKKEQYFCAFTTNNGTQNLGPEDSNLQAIEWVTKLNRRYKSQKLKSSQEVLKKLSSSISSSSSQLDSVKTELHELAVKVSKDCQEKVHQGVLDQRNCDQLKMTVIAEKSSELCSGNKECLKAIKEAIKTGALPLTSSGADLAFSSDNPYKAQSNTQAAEKVATETSATGTNEKKQKTHQNPLSADTDSMAGLLDSKEKEAGEKGETVLTAFGKEKGQEVLSKEITSNEVSGGNLRPPPDTGATTEGTSQTQERMAGLLKDVGINQKDLEKLKNSDTPEVKIEVGQPAPTKEEVQKAINTFKRVFYGRKIDKIEGVEKYCLGTSSGLERAVGMLPFLVVFDPFLDYLGYIRDVQGAKQ